MFFGRWPPNVQKTWRTKTIVVSKIYHGLPPGPGAKFEGLQRAADESGTGPCAQPMRLPGDPCRVGPKPRQKAAPRTISKQAGASAASDTRAKCGNTDILLQLLKYLKRWSEWRFPREKVLGSRMYDPLRCW